MRNVTLRQISSLEKIRSKEDIKNDVEKIELFLGEHYSYQIVAESQESMFSKISVESELADYINIYSVENSVMDLTWFCLCEPDDDYITLENGVMPDMLVPMDKQNNGQMLPNGVKAFWVEVCVPSEFKAGEYDITVTFKSTPTMPKDEPRETKTTLKVKILDKKLPKQELLYTQWFHTDCISSVHNVEIYSEEHWDFIEKYIKTAAEIGINMILTPVITPPLDTEVGSQRPNVQLVKITKDGDKYSFDFSLLKRWISLCRKYGIEHFEISHLFTQWGAGFAPNIYVCSNGELVHEFGWHVKSDDEKYVSFLNQFLPSLMEFFKGEGIDKNCYFHLSDEPKEEHLSNYKKAYNIVKPLIGECGLMDALSHYAFYENGLVENPVCATDEIEPFIEHNTENLWAYVCCGQGNKVANRFLSMPSHRNRIFGLQLYKYGIKGFLQWGYNFYYSQLSYYEVNPYVTSSCGGAFPSGDAFSVYPTKGEPYKSLRALVFYEALQDILICRMLEEKIGRKAVIELIDKRADMDVRFAQYPRNSKFIPELIDEMKRMIAEN